MSHEELAQMMKEQQEDIKQGEEEIQVIEADKDEPEP
jgi:hypothetical protein